MADGRDEPAIEVTAPPGEQIIVPVRGSARIDALDVLRGFAILAIFYMNLPDMAGPFFATDSDPRALGWSVVDQHAFVFIRTFLNGTQRGLLEMLFGAGMLVMFRKAMAAGDPVEVADIYVRRNLWLLFFGMCDVYLLLWYGDIIHGYALCGLALFPFRKLKPRALLIIGLWFATAQLIGGGAQYVGRVNSIEHTGQTAAALASGKPVSAADRKELVEWNKQKAQVGHPPPEARPLIAQETKARGAGMWDWMTWNWSVYSRLIGHGLLLFTVIEASATMFIGMALFKWGVLQGQRTTRFYLVLLVAGYGFGLATRYIGAHQTMAMDMASKILWPLNEYARLAVTVGHVAAANLLLRLPAGRTVLGPFKAAGQLAFTLYFLQQVIGLYLMYSPWGLNLPSAPGWAHILLYGTLVNAGLLALANVWVRRVGMGPMEWLLRSLAYWNRQPWKAPG